MEENFLSSLRVVPSISLVTEPGWKRLSVPVHSDAVWGTRPSFVLLAGLTMSFVLSPFCLLLHG